MQPKENWQAVQADEYQRLKDIYEERAENNEPPAGGEQ